MRKANSINMILTRRITAKRFWRILLLLTILSACGLANPRSGVQDFDIQRIDIGHKAASVLILDEDKGGFPDLVVCGGSSLTIISDDGTGQYEVQKAIPAGEQPVDIAAGDFDSDGWADLVVANHDTRYVSLFFGGPGGFSQEKSERFMVNVSPHPHAVRVADINEDGYSDFLVDDRDNESLSVFLGLGNGLFDPGEPIMVGGDPYRGMSLADINNDGHLDVITPNPLSVAIQVGDGTGTFVAVAGLESANMPPFSTAVGDFNGDGIADIAAGSGEGKGQLMIWLGKAFGSFTKTPDATYMIADGPTKLRTADINGDNLDDILVSCYTGNEVAIALGAKMDLKVNLIELDDNPWDIAVEDLDDNGQMEIVISSDGGTHINILWNYEYSN